MQKITFHCPRDPNQKCAIPNRGDLTWDGKATVYPTILCKGCGWCGMIIAGKKVAIVRGVH